MIATFTNRCPVNRVRRKQAITLDVAGGTDGTPRREFVLVDAENIVLATYGAAGEATETINALFDLDPGLIDQRRLVLVEDGDVSFDWWPRGGSPAERAGVAAKQLSGATQRKDDREVEQHIRRFFLRGRVCHGRVNDEECRTVELWWYLASGEHDTVGLLVEQESEGGWRLYLDGATRGLSDHQLYQRIALTMEDFGDDRWTLEEVARVARRGLDPLTRAMGPSELVVEALLDLADRLHVTEPLGQAWR